MEDTLTSLQHRPWVPGIFCFYSQSVHIGLHIQHDVVRGKPQLNIKLQHSEGQCKFDQFVVRIWGLGIPLELLDLHLLISYCNSVISPVNLVLSKSKHVQGVAIVPSVGAYI